MSAATPTSPAMAATLPFAPAPMVLTASSRPPRPRAMTATSAPEAATRVAIARPMPLLPPAITAVRPARLTSIFYPPDGAERRTRVTLLERDDLLSSHHPAPAFCLCVIFSENRWPLFGIPHRRSGGHAHNPPRQDSP